MYVVTFIFKNHGQVVQLHYKDEAPAFVKDYVTDKMNKGLIYVFDDYGAHISVDLDQVACLMVADLEQELSALEAKMLLKHETDSRVQRKMQESAGRIITPKLAS